MDKFAVRWSPAWFVENSSTLVLSAGSDRRLALPGLSEALRSTLTAWSTSTSAFAVNQLATDERLLLDRLVDVGAVVPANDTRTVFVAGDGADWLSALLPGNGISVVTSAECDSTVLMRGRNGWPDLPSGPHLGVDCMTHHTLVLGPFVLPGLSACTACLDVRTARRWTNVDPSPAPMMSRWHNVIAELVTIQLDLAVRNSSQLVNATIAWDLERGTVDRQTLLKSPGCSYCESGVSSGRISLPWDRS